MSEICSKIYIGLHVKYLLLLSDFNEPRIFSTGFQKNTQVSNFMKIRPVRAELFRAYRRTDGWTDTTKLIVDFFNFAKEPKNPTRRPHSVLTCFLWISEQTSIIYLCWVILLGFGFCNRDGECLLRGKNWIFKYNARSFFFSAGPTMAQAFSRRPVTTEAPVRSQVSPCEICGGQSGTGTGFSSSTSLFPCQYHSTSAP